VTNPSPGVWHYEYAVYNQDIDRAIQSFSVPVGAGVTLSNVGFHAPPQHPGWGADGTVGSSGFSNSPWTSSQGSGLITWGSETFATNQNANAIRWGSLYNFRLTRMTSDDNECDHRLPEDRGSSRDSGGVKSGSCIECDGRVVTLGIPGIRAYVYEDAGGVTRTGYTNAFGYFFFDNVTARPVIYVPLLIRRREHFPAGVLVAVNETTSPTLSLPNYRKLRAFALKRRPLGRLFCAIDNPNRLHFGWISSAMENGSPPCASNFTCEKMSKNPAFAVEKCEAKSVCFLLRRLGSKSLLKNLTQVSDV
jgi:hypothetical protein